VARDANDERSIKAAALVTCGSAAAGDELIRAEPFAAVTLAMRRWWLEG
jgi:hypothetical protein